MNEIQKGLEYVNSRSNKDYETIDEVINGAAQLAARIVAGEDCIDLDYDNHIMALDLFRAGGVVGPLRSASMREASQIWLSRN